jgi:hypothetical protein
MRDVEVLSTNEQAAATLLRHGVSKLVMSTNALPAGGISIWAILRPSPAERPSWAPTVCKRSTSGFGSANGIGYDEACNGKQQHGAYEADVSDALQPV